MQFAADALSKYTHWVSHGRIAAATDCTEHFFESSCVPGCIQGFQSERCPILFRRGITSKLARDFAGYFST
jgi:hypothetical protein